MNKWFYINNIDMIRSHSMLKERKKWEFIRDTFSSNDDQKTAQALFSIWIRISSYSTETLSEVVKIIFIL